MGLFFGGRKIINMTNQNITVQSNSITKYIIASSIALAIFVIVVLLLYALPVNSITLTLFRLLPIPVAKVDSSYVSLSQIEHETNSRIKDNPALQQKFKAYANLKAAGKLLNTYNIPAAKKATEADKLIEVKIWWNGQENLNTKAWQKMKQVQAALFSNDDFGQASQQYSEDLATKQFNGDAGFVSLNDVLPEYAEKVALIKPGTGDKLVIVSRNGLHLVELLEVSTDNTNTTRFHIREIFIASVGFEDWYNSQISNIKALLYIK